MSFPQICIKLKSVQFCRIAIKIVSLSSIIHNCNLSNFPGCLCTSLTMFGDKSIVGDVFAQVVRTESSQLIKYGCDNILFRSVTFSRDIVSSRNYSCTTHYRGHRWLPLISCLRMIFHVSHAMKTKALFTLTNTAPQVQNFCLLWLLLWHNDPT